MGSEITDPETQAAAKNIRVQLTAYTTPGPRLSSLWKRLEEPHWGQVAPYAQRILKIFDLLLECDLEQIPVNRFAGLLNCINGGITQLNSVVDFSPESRQAPNDYLSRMKGAWLELYQNAMPDIAYANLLSEKAESEVALIMGDLRIALEAAKSTNGTLQLILEDAKTAAGKIGITEQAKHFKELADNYERDGRTWFKALFVAIVVAFAYAAIYLPHQINTLPSELSPGRITQLIFNRVLVVSLLFFGIGWLARNYTASRHNFVTNQHRQTALSTFETIVNGVKDDEQKRNAVLVYAAQAIFMPAATGYGKGDIEVQQINPIVDLASSASKFGR